MPMTVAYVYDWCDTTTLSCYVRNTLPATDHTNRNPALLSKVLDSLGNSAKNNWYIGDLREMSYLFQTLDHDTVFQFGPNTQELCFRR